MNMFDIDVARAEQVGFISFSFVIRDDFEEKSSSALLRRSTGVEKFADSRFEDSLLEFHQTH